MFAAALALAAAVSWGIGDFLGGIKSRVASPIAILIAAQPIGGALLGIWVALRGEGPPGAVVLWACLAALFGTVGLVAFYRGMAAGALSIVAPIAGAGAAIPVFWGLAHGERPSLYQELGFVAALAGIALASWERQPQAARLAAGVGWAAIALVTFGCYPIPMQAASRGDFLWAAFVFRLSSTTLIAAAWLAVRPARVRRRDLPAVVGIGVLDTGGNVLFAAASIRGLLSVVTILASLYPIVTVLLARAFLRERVHRTQELGIGLALVGIVLISAG